MKYRFSYLAEDEELYTKDRITLEEAVDFIRNFKGRKGGVFVLTALRNEESDERVIEGQTAERPEDSASEAGPC